MKNLLPLMLLFCSLFVMAQAPNAINYQAIASDGSGAIANADVSVEVELLQMGVVVYTETHAITTNEFGHYTLQVGLGSTTFGDFASLDWQLGNMSLGIAMDTEGGTNYQALGEAPMLAVPYALYALSGGTPGATGPAGPTGPQGEDGFDGEDAQAGPQGPQGETGPQGNSGPAGSTGNDGSDGADGNDGSDGLNCWDFNGNGIANASEDQNSDGLFNALDCVSAWSQQAGNVSVTGNVGIGTSAPAEALHVIGNICYTGTSGACSDERYKTEITQIKNALEAILSLRGVTYDWKVDEFPAKNFTEQEQLGVIAQEVEAFFPQIVLTDLNGFKSVDYGKLTAVLIEAVKDQQSQIAQLQQSERQMNETFTSRLETLESLLLEKK